MKWKKNEAQNSEARVEKLADEVRSTAQQSMEALWSAFLEVGELDMVRATEKALRLMVSHGDCTGAMKVLEGVYALVEIAPSETVYKRDIEDARAYFTRIGADLTARFAALGSKCVELDAADRLRILHDFYRAGDEGSFHFDMADMARKGHDFRDYICPDGIEKHSDYLKLGDRYCRVLFLNSLPFHKISAEEKGDTFYSVALWLAPALGQNVPNFMGTM